MGEYNWENIIERILLGQYYWDNIIRTMWSEGAHTEQRFMACALCVHTCAFAFDTRYEFKRKKRVKTCVLSGCHDRMTICL